jgi:general secretion pathway protein B
MSFILDALRKSEAERQRQDGPTLLEMRPSRPQRRMPLWVIGLGVLLLLNIAVLLWFLLRTPAPGSAARLARAPAAAPAAPSSAPALGTPPVLASTAPPAPLLAPSATAPANATAPASSSAPPASAHVPAAVPAHSRPRLEPSDSAADLPDYSRVSAGLPALRLDLHSYSDQPQQRYALINMHKVQEGDTLPEGPRVLHILPEGVVLSYQGTEFVLGRN